MFAAPFFPSPSESRSSIARPILVPRREMFFPTPWVSLCNRLQSSCRSSWWAHLDSNQGPTGYEPVALPAELWARFLSPFP